VSTEPNSFELCRVASELDDSQNEYWLDLLHETIYLEGTLYKSINDDCGELIRILTSIIKKNKGRSKEEITVNCQLSTVNSEYNQAIMDFGAIQCTPASPNCMFCPLIESCIAFRENRVAELPVKLKTLKITERHLTYIYVRCNGYTAIHRRGAGDIWQGLWEPWLNNEIPAGAVLLKQHVKHVLTHRVLYADFYLWEVTERPQLPDNYIWIKESELDDYAKPRLIEKYLIPLL
jgi:A/G-specific adenine glycosylase